MSDSKYGRLFTEADVRKLLSRYGGLLDAPEVQPVIDEFHDGTFPADEPLFLLRGQDAAAPDAIATGIGGEDESVVVMDYYQSASKQGAPNDHLARVITTAQEMAQWQRDNPDRVTTPD